MSYESSLKAQRDYYSSISFAEKKAMEKGWKKEKSFKVVENLFIKLGLTDQQAADIAEVPVNFVKKIRASLKKKQWYSHLMNFYLYAINFCSAFTIFSKNTLKAL